MGDAPELEVQQSATRQRLARVRRVIRAQLLLEGLAAAAATAAALAALSFAGDVWFRFDWSVRAALLVLAAAGIAAVLALRLLRPLTTRLPDLHVACLLEPRYPGLVQRVANVLELPGYFSHGDVSAAMIRAAVEADAAAVMDVEPRRVVSVVRRRFSLAVLAAAAALPLLAALVAPHMTWIWSLRWLALADVRWPQRHYLAIEGLTADGRIVTPRGEPAFLSVHSQPVFERVGDDWTIPSRSRSLRIPVLGATAPVPAPTPSIRARVQPPEGPAVYAAITALGSQRARLELPPLHAPATLTLTGGDDWLGPIAIEPADRPTLARMQLTARGPGSRGDQVLDPRSAGSLLFLPQTELELLLTADQDLADMTLQAATGSAPALAVVDRRQRRAAWTFATAQNFEVVLTAQSSGLRSPPFLLSLGLLADRPPRVTVRATGVGPRITPMARIPVTGQALDDFGIVRTFFELEAAVLQPPKAAQTRTIPAATASEAGSTRLEWQGSAEITLADDGLGPGAVVKLRAVADDNCHLGKQTGVSRWLTFQVVSAEELFYEILTRLRAERARYKTTVAAAQAARDALAGVPETAAVKAALRHQQGAPRQVSQTAARLDAALAELTLNDLGTAQARTLLAEQIIAPLRALAAERLPLQGARLERMAQLAAPLAADWQEAQAEQRALASALARVLEQMAQWESFVDVVNQLEEIKRLQQSVLQDTEKTRKQKLDKLFDD